VLKDFYTAFGTVSFTVLGIWMFVVQTRRTEWARSPEHLRRAYGIHLQFGLAGLMSMLSLVDPDSKLLWRTSFSVSAVVGVLVLLRLHTRGSKGLDRVASAGNLVAAALFVVVFLVAAFPDLPGELGIDLAPIRVEAIALSSMIFLGVNMAWLLMFAEVPANEPIG
jgi:hypothetical protein